jgi:hypothetical protein
MKNHTLISYMDIVEASGAFMDRNIVGSQVEVVGIGELQRGQLCNKHHVCGSQLCTRRMFLRYFTLTVELWAVRWGICQSIWPLELIIITACVHTLLRLSPAIAPVVPALQNARKTILALGVAWPLLRECVTCLQLRRLVKK